MRTELLVTSHIHTDGPIPGPHSLLSLTSVARLPDGRTAEPIRLNLRQLPGATLHPVSLQRWRRRPEDWLCTRRAARPPALAVRGYARWLDRLPGPAVLVTDPAADDHLFLYWYLQRFAGGWPFADVLADAALRDRLHPDAGCPLAGCRPVLLARTG